MALFTASPQWDLRSGVAAGRGGKPAGKVDAATAQQDRYRAEDAAAWRSVCGVLIAVVALGALSMAVIVAAIVLTS